MCLNWLIFARLTDGVGWFGFLVCAYATFLIFFVIATTFYFHDFWNQPAPDNARTLIDALKNLSIIGALCAHEFASAHQRLARGKT